MLAAILGGMLFATQAFGQAVLNLKVDDSETALELVNETGTGNCAGKVAGDVCAAKNQKPTITFNLTGNRDCSAGGDWALSQVVLAPDGDKPGRNGWGRISAEAVADFNADARSGVVTPTGTPSASRIDIYDRNNNELTVWYKVEATCGSDTIQYDPRIRNGGID
jgi:hypothetical protein